MFDIFKPPRHHIKKRVPKAKIETLTEIEHFVDDELFELSHQKREYGIAFILSVYVCQMTDRHIFSVSLGDYEFIQRSGMVCAQKLSGIDFDCVESVLQDLIAHDWEIDLEEE
ncbi:MAG: hypothetical protein RIC29_12095 [Rhodospirillaceae bacterium]